MTDDFNRIQWHSRRGMLEIDLFLVPFVREHFVGLAAADQQLYRQLLDCEDQDIVSWLLRHRAPEDAGISRIINLILERHGTAGAHPG